MNFSNWRHDPLRRGYLSSGQASEGDLAHLPDDLSPLRNTSTGLTHDAPPRERKLWPIASFQIGIFLRICRSIHGKRTKCMFTPVG